MSERFVENPKVFISYSWSTQAHEDRVLAFAERLVSNGIDVILDKWGLKEGQDKYVFMESMVTDASVTNVLIILDKAYANKADSKKGGVGAESQIISKEIYEKVDQEKFIPVVFECDENGAPYLPVLLRNRVYIDLNSPELMQENYPRLLRILYGKPAIQKPVLGKPPAFVSEDRVPLKYDQDKLAILEVALQEDRSTTISIAEEFLESVSDGLEDFILDPVAQDMPAELRRVIGDLIQPRDVLVSFASKYFRYRQDSDSLEPVIAFFERCLSPKYPPRRPGPVYDYAEDHFAFFNHEILLYLVALLIQRRRFKLAGELLSHGYYIERLDGQESAQVVSFGAFRSYSRILERENQKKNPRRLSPEADLLKSRSNVARIPFTAIQEADMVLYLRYIMNDADVFNWYPCTMVYAAWGQVLPYFARMRDNNWFSGLAEMIGVKTRDEFKQRFEAAMGGRAGEMARRMNFDGDVDLSRSINYGHIVGEV